MDARSRASDEERVERGGVAGDEELPADDGGPRPRSAAGHHTDEGTSRP